MRIFVLATCAALVSVALGGFSTLDHASNAQATPPRLIAHAGGAIDGVVYCNCLEALELNYSLGHRHFELDFCPTSDAHWVGIHDWERSWQRLFGGTPANPRDWRSFPTLEAFVSAPMLYGYTPLTIELLNDWLRTHPDAYIVTDIRGGNVKGLQYIADRSPGLLDRYIPQIYHRDEYEPATALGFNRIIYTLYSTKDSPEEIAEFVASHPLYAVTTNPTKQDVERILSLLADLGQIVYLHTYNEVAQVEDLLKSMPIHGVYTDFLAPDSLTPSHTPDHGPLATSQLKTVLTE